MSENGLALKKKIEELQSKIDSLEVENFTLKKDCTEIEMLLQTKVSLSDERVEETEREDDVIQGH